MTNSTNLTIAQFCEGCVSQLELCRKARELGLIKVRYLRSWEFAGPGPQGYRFACGCEVRMDFAEISCFRPFVWER